MVKNLKLGQAVLGIDGNEWIFARREKSKTLLKIPVLDKAKEILAKYSDSLYGKNGDLIGAPEGKALGKLVDQKPMNSGLTNHQFIDAFWELTLKTLEN